MKQLLLIGILTISAIVVLIACGGGSTNVSVNANSNYNSNSNSNSNSNGSYIGNAANSVSNAASSMMTPSPESFIKDAAEGGMAGYLDALPTRGPEGRLARALHRQAMLLNGRSSFTSEPATIGISRFAIGSSALRPMRSR